MSSDRIPLRRSTKICLWIFAVGEMLDVILSKIAMARIPTSYEFNPVAAILLHVGGFLLLGIVKTIIVIGFILAIHLTGDSRTARWCTSCVAILHIALVVWLSYGILNLGFF